MADLRKMSTSWVLFVLVLRAGAEGSETEPGRCYTAGQMAAAGLGGAAAVVFVIISLVMVYSYSDQCAGRRRKPQLPLQLQGRVITREGVRSRKTLTPGRGMTAPTAAVTTTTATTTATLSSSSSLSSLPRVAAAAAVGDDVGDGDAGGASATGDSENPYDSLQQLEIGIPSVYSSYKKRPQPSGT